MRSSGAGRRWRRGGWVRPRRRSHASEWRAGRDGGDNTGAVPGREGSRTAQAFARAGPRIREQHADTGVDEHASSRNAILERVKSRQFASLSYPGKRRDIPALGRGVMRDPALPWERARGTVAGRTPAGDIHEDALDAPPSAPRSGRMGSLASGCAPPDRLAAQHSWRNRPPPGTHGGLRALARTRGENVLASWPNTGNSWSCESPT